GLSAPQGVLFGPNGDLCVASQNANIVVGLDGTTGGCIADCAAGGGLSLPTFLIFMPQQVTCTCPGDMNLDGEVNGADIELFINAILSQQACP
ncbi:MAG: hypothetical protein MI923_09480, partial [Phycisphaerales bacterium]|nr:hypothetical protein [Phycisphaerales bacterium]